MDIFERFKEIIRPIDNPNPFIIEVGCCDSYHSELMLQIIKSVERPFIFHGFEPNDDLHPLILNKLKGHFMFNAGVIGIFPHAVGDVDEEIPFFKSYGKKLKKKKVIDHYYGSSSLLKPTDRIKSDFEGMKFKETKVFCTRLDTHLKKYDLHRRLIDFMWADVQGAEAMLIRGGAEAFKKLRYLYTEYSQSHYEGQSTKEDIFSLLPSFEVVEDYGGDMLLKNKNFSE